MSQNSKSEDENDNQEQIYKTNKSEENKQEQVDYQLDEDDYLRLIAPWEPFYDKTWQRIYYFNQETQESLWDLPEQIQQNISQYQISNPRVEAQGGVSELPSLNQHQQKEQQLIEGQLQQKQEQNWRQQPARKQVEQSLAQNFSYRQGDEIYNIWYNKFLGAEAPETPADRQAATTRCDPELDSGYTKSKNSKQSFFCMHFARGCCSEGANCHYHHHVPELKECELIEASKDIFGRQKFAGFRDDMMGVGSFLKEIRTLQVMGWSGDAEGLGLQEVVKEQLWRHFGIFGEIEDVKVLVAKGHALVRFKHRCMAEFAKEAMVFYFQKVYLIQMLRSLDNNEILVIKWANEENSEEQVIRQRQEEEKAMKEAIYKKQKKEDSERKIIQQQLIQDRKEKESKLAESEYFQQIQLEKEKKQQEYFRNISAMNEVLKKIEAKKQEKETGLNEFNDLPLHFK